MSIFKGAGVAIVTPFKDNGDINYEQLEKLVDWQIERGVDAIVLCGTTGESPTISDDEKREIFKLGVKTADKRVPIIAAEIVETEEGQKLIAGEGYVPIMEADS